MPDPKPQTLQSKPSYLDQLEKTWLDRSINQRSDPYSRDVRDRINTTYAIMDPSETGVLSRGTPETSAWLHNQILKQLSLGTMPGDIIQRFFGSKGDVQLPSEIKAK